MKAQPMADPAAQPFEGIQVVIEDEDGKVTTDPITGTVATPQPDGGVVVQLDAHRPKKAGDDDEDKFYRNLADDIAPNDLSLIANDLHDQIAADDRSRGNHLEIRARGLGLLGLELKEPRATVGDTSSAVEGMSTVTNPLLLEACLKGWANAQAELLPSDGPVKVANKDDASVQSEDNLADAFERDLNHYLTKTATEYYPDTSHMLLWGTYFGGSGFKKIYRCPMKRRPVSESVDEKDLIVSDTTKDLRSCARITHQIPMRPSVMKRMELMGHIGVVLSRLLHLHHQMLLTRRLPASRAPIRRRRKRVPRMSLTRFGNRNASLIFPNMLRENSRVKEFRCRIS